MIINVEFLDREPIENVITSLNYKVDKTIFFGFEEDSEGRMAKAERFLKKNCAVKKVDFHGMSRTNLEENIVVMKEVLQKEIDAGNDLFVDVTGGEGIILLGFGILASQMNLPLHKYDVKKNWLYELNREVGKSLSLTAERQYIDMDIDMFIEMHGGVVNYAMQKEIKSLEDSEMAADMEVLWKLCSKHRRAWNVFSEFLRDFCPPDSSLTADVNIEKARKEIRGRKKYTSGKLAALFDDCVKEGIFTDAGFTEDGSGNKYYVFKYKNETVMDLLWDAGSVLELHTYSMFYKDASDCRVGVHIDWDGVIRGGKERDTVNEIDVMVLNGFIPTFISCKNGNVDRTALYELETVAKRFGGEHVRKALVVTQTVNKSIYGRGKEMDIEIIKA